jgi:hypothetical protein
MDVPVSEMGSTRAREVVNVAVLAYVREDARGLIHNIALLDGELVEACWVREVALEKFRSLSGASTNGARWLVVSEMEHQEQFE